MAEWLRQGPAKPCTRVRFPLPPRWAVSSAGERFPDTEEATGSIPVPHTRSEVLFECVLGSLAIQKEPNKSQTVTDPDPAACPPPPVPAGLATSGDMQRG